MKNLQNYWLVLLLILEMCLLRFFGGLALIIARTKKGTIATVIFGVAIATALMPPLCTVGYGLAEAFLGNTRGLSFAGGAMYLFIINTIFIALATFLVLKVLRFPMIKYVNSVRRKNIARFASFLALLVMIPAGITFYNVLKESTFKNSAKRFIETELEALPNASYIKKYATYDFNKSDISSIELTSFGSDQISEETMNVLRGRMQTYSALSDVRLVLNQSKKDDSFEDEVRYMEELRSRDSLDLFTKNQKIIFLEEKVAQLSKLEKDQIPFKELCDEARINYETLLTLSYSRTLSSNLGRIDTLSQFRALWNDSLGPEALLRDQTKLYNWLKYELKQDTLVLENVATSTEVR